MRTFCLSFEFEIETWYRAFRILKVHINTLAILNKNVEDANTGYFSLDCSPNDNPPLIIHGLDRMSSIGLRFNILETGALFTLMANYVAIINFEQM